MTPTKLDLYRAKLAELENGGERASKWTPKAGVNVIRIIPAYDPRREGLVEFYREWWMCFKVGTKQRVIVPRYQFGDQACPMKRRLDELQRMTDEISKREYLRIRPSLQVGIWVIDRNDEFKGPQLWYATKNVLRKILSICTDPDYGDVTEALPDGNRKGARDLTIEYTPKDRSKTNFAEYEIRAKPDATPLGTPEQMTAWTSEDLFEKYRVGKPSDAGWIEAVLSGTEDQYLQGLAGQGGETESSAPDAPGSAVAPWEVSSPYANVAFPVGTLPTTKFWIYIAGTGVAMTDAGDIALKVLAGQDPQIMDEAKTSNWKPASAFGFRVKEAAPAAPSAPASPEAPTAPGAPTSAVLSSPLPGTRDAMAEELARLREKMGMSGTAVNGIESQLKS